MFLAKVAFVFEEPKTCFACPFLGKPEYIPDYGGHYGPNDWLYKQIAECKLAPDSVEDPWKEFHWLAENKSDWCPLKPVKED